MASKEMPDKREDINSRLGDMHAGVQEYENVTGYRVEKNEEGKVTEARFRFEKEEDATMFFVEVVRKMRGPLTINNYIDPELLQEEIYVNKVDINSPEFNTKIVASMDSRLKGLAEKSDYAGILDIIRKNQGDDIEFGEFPDPDQFGFTDSYLIYREQDVLQAERLAESEFKNTDSDHLYKNERHRTGRHHDIEALKETRGVLRHTTEGRSFKEHDFQKLMQKYLALSEPIGIKYINSGGRDISVEGNAFKFDAGEEGSTACYEGYIKPSEADVAKMIGYKE